MIFGLKNAKHFPQMLTNLVKPGTNVCVMADQLKTKAFKSRKHNFKMLRKLYKTLAKLHL